MKVLRMTKEIEQGEFKGIIRKMSALQVMEIQKKAVKFKDSAAGVEITKQNIFQHIDTDQAVLRVGQVAASLVGWNLEDELGNPLPISEETIKSVDFPNDLFLFIEGQVNEFNAPSKKETKN